MGRSIHSVLTYLFQVLWASLCICRHTDMCTQDTRLCHSVHHRVKILVIPIHLFTNGHSLIIVLSEQVLKILLVSVPPFQMYEMLLTFIADLQFSIPRNTATVRAKGTVVVFWCDIAFTNWLFCVCEIMGLNVNTAELGYKYNGQRVGDHPTQLLSDNDLCIAISMGQGMATRMITKTLCIMIYNLVSLISKCHSLARN